MSEALNTAARLEAMGITIRSVELSEEAKRRRDFIERGGNRRMRRAAAKAKKRAAKR